MIWPVHAHVGDVSSSLQSKSKLTSVARQHCCSIVLNGKNVISCYVITRFFVTNCSLGLGWELLSTMMMTTTTTTTITTMTAPTKTTAAWIKRFQGQFIKLFCWWQKFQEIKNLRQILNFVEDKDRSETPTMELRFNSQVLKSRVIISFVVVAVVVDVVVAFLQLQDKRATYLQNKRNQLCNQQWAEDWKKFVRVS